MLAMADKRGRVWASIPGLASRAKVTIPETETALECFLTPDKYSRTQDFEGRRIEAIDGGWRLLNHAKYRGIRDEEERRIYKSEWQRKSRSVDKVDRNGPARTSVDSGGHNAEAEAYTEAEAEISSLNGKAWSDYLEHRADLKKPLTTRGANMQIAKLAVLPHDVQQAVVDLSIANGWTGLFPEKRSKSETHKRNDSFDDTHARVKARAGLS